MTKEARKPLAALLIEEKEPKGAPAEKEKGEPEDEESVAAADFITALGVTPKDPEAATAAITDLVRMCVAKQKRGGYAA